MSIMSIKMFDILAYMSGLFTNKLKGNRLGRKILRGSKIIIIIIKRYIIIITKPTKLYLTTFFLFGKS